MSSESGKSYLLIFVYKIHYSVFHAKKHVNNFIVEIRDRLNDFFSIDRTSSMFSRRCVIVLLRKILMRCTNNVQQVVCFCQNFFSFLSVMNEWKDHLRHTCVHKKHKVHFLFSTIPYRMISFHNFYKMALWKCLPIDKFC